MINTEWQFNGFMDCDKCKFSTPLCGAGYGCPYLAGWQDGQAKLISYLFETCPHNDIDLGGDGVTMCYRHACGQCMVELKENKNG